MSKAPRVYAMLAYDPVPVRPGLAEIHGETGRLLKGIGQADDLFF